MSIGITTSTSGMKTNIETFKHLYSTLKYLDTHHPKLDTIKDCIEFCQMLDHIYLVLEDIAQCNGWLAGFDYVQYPNGQKKYNLKYRNLESCILIAFQISHSKLKTGKSRYCKDVPFFLNELSELAEKLLDTDTHT